MTHEPEDSTWRRAIVVAIGKVSKQNEANAERERERERDEGKAFASGDANCI